MPARAHPHRGRADQVARVLVDGRNVQHALARDTGSGVMPTTALIARLRAAFGRPTEVELILDGHPGGGPQGKVAPGFRVAFSRAASADQVIGERVVEALRELGPAGAWSVLVVTDDREVRDHARRHGARVEGSAWLASRLRNPAAAGGPAGAPAGRGQSIGHGRAPRGAAGERGAPRGPRG